ncbi:MAG: hypothetical protein ACRENU_02195 [Gemmatimonadaceae bacterium]
MIPLVGPVSTYGLTHLALAVSDPERAFGFYSQVCGMVDLDGYLLEIWYEIPTSADPAAGAGRTLQP